MIVYLGLLPALSALNLDLLRLRRLILPGHLGVLMEREQMVHQHKVKAQHFRVENGKNFHLFLRR
jgi:hypothetical protein